MFVNEDEIWIEIFQILFTFNENIGWPLTKYQFTEVNQFKKLKNITDKKVFPLEIQWFLDEIG